MIKLGTKSRNAYIRFILRKNSRKFKSKIHDLGMSTDADGFVAFRGNEESIPVFFEALHGFGDDGNSSIAEVKTAQIAHLASDLSGAGLIMALKPRSVCDLNRGENARISHGYVLNKKNQRMGTKQYIGNLTSLVRKNKRFFEGGRLNGPFFMISVHGMKDRKKRDVDIGSGRGRLCKRQIAKWFTDLMKRHFEKRGIPLRINLDKGFTGGAHPKRIKDVNQLGKRFQYLQVELSKTTRLKYGEEMVKFFVESVKLFKKKRWNKKKPVKRCEFGNADLKGYLKSHEFDENEPLKRVYLDRSQRISLKAKRNSVIRMKYTKDKELELEVHQARHFQIGENKILINNKLIKRLKVKEGRQVKLINKSNYVKN